MTDEQAMKILADRVNNIFNRARSGIELPQTPEQEYLWNQRQLTMWGRMFEQIMGVVEDAYCAIPEVSVEGSSPRTVLLESAIREMTEKLIEYPSSPYTLTSTESLSNTINALKTSIEIDKMKDE